jgi:hypothetical protein
MNSYNGLNGETASQTPGGQPCEQYANMATPQMIHVMQSGPTVYGSYHRKQSQGLGVCLIVVGALCIIFNAVAIGFFQPSSFIAYGIWGGILFIISGSFGTSASKYSSKCRVVTFMVMCILSACSAAVSVILGAAAAAYSAYAFEALCASYDHRDYDYDSRSYYYMGHSCKDSFNVGIAMNALIAILSFIGGVAAIWGSAICCRVACCCSNTNRNFVPMPNNHQVITIPQHQMHVLQMTQQPYPGQVFVSNPQAGYPSQPMMYVAAPSYEVTPSASTMKSPITN